MLNQSQDLEHHKKKIEDRQRQKSNEAANNSSTESEPSRPRTTNWGPRNSSHHDLRSVKLVLESNISAPDGGCGGQGDEKKESGDSAAAAPRPAQVLTNVFVPTRTQLFTVPPEGERPNLTRRLVVIDETRKPTTALCEFVDDAEEEVGSSQEVGVATAGVAAAEGPNKPNVDLKANLEQYQRETSQWRSGAAAMMPFSPSCSSVGPENQLCKSASPFSPMQTHSRSQLSLQLSAVANRPPEPETVDSPTLVVIDPSVEAILNDRRPRSPSAPGTPTNSSQVVSLPCGYYGTIRFKPRHNGTD